MSTVYFNEPPTSGKVLLKTSIGEIEVELWPRHAPTSCRAFLQLCVDGAYDDVLFHRVLPGFVAQSGNLLIRNRMRVQFDEGSLESFDIETNSRLKFNHRGIVAMASDEISGVCTNEFFITLDKTMELAGQHSIFGKVVGDTIFNVLKMNDLEIGENDRPVFPPVIQSVEVLHNPFSDIFPRNIFRKEEITTQPTDTVQRKQRKAIRNKKLLSFGDDEGEPLVQLKSKRSAHDLIDQARLGRSAIEPPKELVLSKEKPVKTIEREIKTEIVPLQKVEPIQRDLSGEIDKLKRELSKSNVPRRESEKVRTLLGREKDAFIKSSGALTKRQKSKADSETLDRLKSFSSKLRTVGKVEAVGEEKSFQDDMSIQDTSVDQTDWMTHSLHFGTGLHGKNVLDPGARRMDNAEDLLVIDPLEHKAKFKAN